MRIGNAVVVTILLGASLARGAEALPEVVRVETGQVRGLAGPDVVSFRGIPFAAPPTGPLRFAPPQAPQPWTGIRDATVSMTPCSQGTKPNEDCLYLNIAEPRAHGTSLMPVMVWLHGGGLSAGSGSTYESERLVTQGGVVVVTVDFRLNIFGFFAHAGLKDSGDFGLEDQQAALAWIRRNIRAFGGDPNKVTLFGQSGGGVGTCAQLTSPGARGLFQRAIFQSGGCSTSWPRNGAFLGQAAGSFFEPLATMEAKGARVAAKVGCTSDDPHAVIACLRGLPAAAIQAEASSFWAAAYGTAVLPVDPAKAMAAGEFPRVPVMAGFARNESRAVASGMQLTGHPITEAGYPGLLHDAFGDQTEKVMQHYPLSQYNQAALAWSAIYTDRMFVCPQLTDARALAKHVPTYTYEFADPNGIGLIPFLPGFPGGASHTSELPLLFDMTDGPLDIATGKKIPLSDEKALLAHTMIGYWTQFARTGDPNAKGAPRWPRFDSRAAAPQVLALAPGQNGIAEVDAWQSHQCSFWAGLTD